MDMDGQGHGLFPKTTRHVGLDRMGLTHHDRRHFPSLGPQKVVQPI